ncbi:TMEM165/GDT1 family protein [Fusibacter ferrireducens]|uniref:TMEM165/GDT1 family protein n=1 Tax=Fusibacter ferrireducens TaxID=2785058 RepID=A0ABS0A059_9FIRM|nr:TMEM165/GDT1 family protein [Fusibacter ferrireducens]MBF4695520.1 TMEM165/GDT1 family protein [Fusibacter ferrireducens]
MIGEIIKAFILIFIAEMGDKTQILAMAFATRFPVKKVLLGIGIGAFLNHGLAVLLGSYLSSVVPISTIQMIAGAAFVGFAIWTLKIEEDEDDEEPKFQFGPVGTVSLAFFLGELGDKTQLTAITLAADAKYPFFILVGTVAGMIATGALGIIVGKKMGDKVPEIGIKLFAATIFMFFGIQKLFSTVPEAYLQVKYVLPVLVILLGLTGFMVVKLFRHRKAGIQSAYRAKAQLLHNYYEHIREDLDSICMGTEYCKTCSGEACIIGHAKKRINAIIEDKEAMIPDVEEISVINSKPFSQAKAMDSLVDTLWLLENIENHSEIQMAHMMRKKMEIILLGKEVDPYECYDAYIEKIMTVNKDLAKEVRRQFNLRKPIEQRIINVGNRISNIYLVESKEGYILVDTGYEAYFETFKSELQKNNIGLDEIAYIFVTHAHDDHVGFLNQLMAETTAQIITHHKAVPQLAKGQNSFKGGCSTRLAWLFCQVMKLAGKGEHKFQPVEVSDRFLIIKEQNRAKIEELLSGKIIDLPGHTQDSIGLLLNDEILFCGDAVMNGLPSRHHIIIWIEDILEYKNSWKKMMALDYRKVYPAHGKPISKDRIISNFKSLKKIKSYRLSS